MNSTDSALENIPLLTDATILLKLNSMEAKTARNFVSNPRSNMLFSTDNQLTLMIVF